ncbi:amino acid ABC transporter permease [Alkalibacter mobilis]|uniref:amino acid ABC transporter permease n=1 Tax=Alkalibacter mobilis TaxID=2787712 RepID=UPI00189D6A92|nr:amino acid ABC transporter permease [Alkalibacter mobilis]MBF7096094.1 amino acid ABC transporter permease [Alkalibacter mobilis]
MALVDGTILTMQLTLIGITAGIVLGVLLALGRISKSRILNGITWVYVWAFRGTPLLMQLFIIVYAVPLFTLDLFGFPLRLPILAAAAVAYSLNSAAYLAEIIRAGIQSIDKGQMEASKALGMSYYQAMFKIIIPQAYRRLIPPVGNELIMLLKDTSLVASIGLFDVLRTTSQMTNATGKAFYYIYAAIIYLFFTTIIQVVFDKVEKKYSIYD